MAMQPLKNHRWAIFQQQFKYRLTLKLLQNVDRFDTAVICTPVILNEKTTPIFSHIPAHAIEISHDFSIAVAVHGINKQENQTAKN